MVSVMDRDHYVDNLLDRVDALERQIEDLQRTGLIVDGKLVVGEGNVRIDTEGIALVDDGHDSVTRIKWKDEDFQGETLGDIISDWTQIATEDVATWIRAFEHPDQSTGEAQIILKVDNQAQTDDTRLTLKSATHKIEFGGVDLFEIRDDAGDTLYFSAEDGGDILSATFGRFVPGTGAPGLSYRGSYFLGSDTGEEDAMEDHFLAYPATGFAWAGAPFVTPGSAEILPASLLRVGTLGGTGNRAFYYKTSPSTGAKFIRIGATTGNTYRAYGLRLDDGSDNNYVEYVFRRLTTQPETHQMEIRSRVGGGAVGTTAGPTISFPPSTLILRFEMSGTRWSSWGCAMRAKGPLNEVIQIGTGPSGLTYTPTRVGIIYDQGPTSYSTWERFFVDFVHGLT